MYYVVSIFNDISVSVRWLPSQGNSSDRGSRMYGPPSSATREEAVRRTYSKEVASQGLGFGPSLGEEDHFVRDWGTDEAAPRLQYDESSSSSDESRKRREEYTTRRTDHATAADASHGLTFLQRFKVRTPTQHAVDSRVASFSRGTTLTNSSGEKSWPATSNEDT